MIAPVSSNFGHYLWTFHSFGSTSILWKLIQNWSKPVRFNVTLMWWKFFLRPVLSVSGDEIIIYTTSVLMYFRCILCNIWALELKINLFDIFQTCSPDAMSTLLDFANMLVATSSAFWNAESEPADALITTFLLRTVQYYNKQVRNPCLPQK